jgi:hypothetical protein
VVGEGDGGDVEDGGHFTPVLSTVL